METEHVPIRHWIATRRDRATGKESHFPVEGVDHLEASKKAKEAADKTFSFIVGVNILE